MITDGYTYLIDGRLAQGSVPPPKVKLPFDFVVFAAEEYPPNLPDHETLFVPLDDSGPPPTAEERWRARRAAHEVARRVRNGERVLVTCFQGRNRSGVITGLALVQLGVPGWEAAQRIRELRNGLTNVYFRQMVVGS